MISLVEVPKVILELTVFFDFFYEGEKVLAVFGPEFGVAMVVQRL
jgi:hypothetical protein